MNKHYYGWRPSAPDPRNHITAAPGTGVKDQVDNRMMYGIPAIYNQLELGSCTANAANRAIRLWYLFNHDKEIGDISRLFTYGSERLREGGRTQFGEDSGAEGRDAFKTARHDGIPKEDAWPYADYKQSFDNYSDYENALAYGERFKIGTYSHPAPEVDLFKELLSNDQQIIFGFNVYEPFESAQVAAHGIIPVPNRNDRLLGGHEVIVEGYLPDYPQHALCANSWDVTWGIKGYFLMPWSYILGYGSSDWRTIDRH